MNDIRLHTVEEVAEILRMHPQFVYRLAQKGTLKGSKVGSKWRFTDAQIADYLETAAKTPEAVAA